MVQNLNLLVTVGTTNFDELISFITKNCANLFSDLGVKNATIQVGKTSSFSTQKWQEKFEAELQENGSKVNVKCVEYLDGFEDLLREFDLVICHAGAGTVLSCLRQ